jgi:hypothetical protein
MIGDEVLPKFIKPVKVLSEKNAPPMDGTRMHVNYFESGSFKRISVNVIRPTHFEKVVVSSVFETAPALKYSDVPLNSLRNAARMGIYTFKRIRQSMRRSIAFSMPMLDMRSLEPNNMAHLLLEGIPYCLYAKRTVGSELRILMKPMRAQFSNLLAAFDIHPVQENRKVTGSFIKIRGTRGLSVFDLFGTFDCYGVNFIPDTYSEMDFRSPLRIEKIFLARRPPRDLANQAEIEKVVEKFGYKTTYMEDHSIAEQLSIGAQAKHVIAVHGAAMSFLIVNKRIDSVIELLPPNVYHEIYPVCLGPRVARYEQIIPDFDPGVAHSGWDAISYFKNRIFSVSANLLDRILSEIHSGSPGTASEAKVNWR